MGTLAKVAVGIAVAKGVGSMMKKGSAGGGGLLGGAGGLIALPWLEAMMPVGRRATAAGEDTPLRLLCYYMPNGMAGRRPT